MKLRKTLVSILAALMVLSSMQMIAFAEGEGTGTAEPYPNFEAEVYLGNEDCVQADSVKDLQLTMTVTKDTDPSVTATLPLTYDVDWQTFAGSAYVEGDAMQTILADLTANQEALLGDEQKETPTVDAEQLVTVKAMKEKLAEEQEEEALDIFNGYTVTVDGLGENSHYTIKTAGYILTSQDVIDSFDFMVELMNLFLAEDQELTAETYAGLMEEVAKLSGYESYEAMLRDPEMGYTEAEIAEELASVEQMDALLAQARAGEYPGELYVEGDLVCDCPDLEYYEIYHEYYKLVDGKYLLAGQVAEGEADDWGGHYLKGEVGDYVSAKDYINCDYDGETYEYVGSWDSYEMYEDLDWEAEQLGEFKIGDPEYDGLVLRYVLAEDDSVPADNDEPQDDATPVNADAEKSPETGDQNPIGLYAALLITAIAAVVALFAYKKRKDR